MERYKKWSRRLTKLIFHSSTGIEWVISLIILLAIIIELLNMVNTYELFSSDLTTVELTEMLAEILGLVVGLEFIKMLMVRSHGAVLEVIMFAIARQLILEHSMIDNLIGIASLVGLFAIWHFLYDKEEEKQRLLELLERIQKKEAANLPLNIEEMEARELIEKAEWWREHEESH